MKYMTKQFGSGEEPWTDGELLFNALIWVTSTRMWGASKELAAIMRRPEKESEVTWNLVELLMPGGQIAVWSRDDGTPFPNITTELDSDDLFPEESTTKQLWLNLYEGIERWRNNRYL
jgi:hypothetical protein